MARVTRNNPTGETQAPDAEVQSTRGRGKKAKQNPVAPASKDEDAAEVNPRQTRCRAKRNAATKPKGNTTKATSGKRKAVPGDEDEPAANPRKVKKTSKKGGDAPPLRYNSEQATSCVIVVECEVKGHETHDCVTTVDADFFLKAPGATKGKKIGEIVTYLVDMSGPKAGKQSKSGPWVSQLLAAEAVDEVQLIFQEIYTKVGAVKKKFVDHTAELTNDTLLFIHTFALSHPEAFGGTGIAQDALKAFTAALPNLPEPWAYTGAIVLSPAADEEVKAARVKAKKWTNDVEAEAGLIASWEKSGFQVWLRGNPKTENSVTIMGRSGSG